MIAVDVAGAQPAEHDVRGALRQALALDDALTVVVELARAEERLEHRRLGLLELQEQRIAVVAPEQEHDPGARSDAADTDHLARGVHVAEALEQVSAVPWTAWSGRSGAPRAAPRPARVLLRREQLVNRER